MQCGSSMPVAPSGVQNERPSVPSQSDLGRAEGRLREFSPSVHRAPAAAVFCDTLLPATMGSKVIKVGDAAASPAASQAPAPLPPPPPPYSPAPAAAPPPAGLRVPCSTSTPFPQELAGPAPLRDLDGSPVWVASALFKDGSVRVCDRTGRLCAAHVGRCRADRLRRARDTCTGRTSLQDCSREGYVVVRRRRATSRCTSLRSLRGLSEGSPPLTLVRLRFRGVADSQGRYDILPVTSDMEWVPAGYGELPKGRRPVEGVR